MCRFLLWAALLISITAGLLTPVEAQAEDVVTFEGLSVELSFPNRITFVGQASSDGPAIVRAELSYSSPSLIGSTSNSVHRIELETGQQVPLLYEQDFSGTTVVPNTPFVYEWHVWTEDGRESTSAPQKFTFEDTRYSWQVRRSDRVAVWTHDRFGDLGQRTFDIAQQAIDRQRPLFGVDLRQQIQLIIYNDFTEFAGWHSTVGGFIGGEAFPGFAITTQIVPLLRPQGGWLSDVVPHEISHLYFAQAADNPTVSVPTWLNEGVASYNEFGDPSAALSRVEQMAAAGELIPLSSLKTGFGSHNEARARLAYDEALSAVTFIVEDFGTSGLSDLLAGYHSGLASDRAFQRSLGMDVGTFEAAWAEWAGAEPATYVTATPWPLPTFPPSPTPRQVGAAAGPAPTSTPRAVPTMATATPVPAERDEPGGRWPVLLVVVLGAGLLVWLIVRRGQSASGRPG
ncbi:MAG: peptidase MA family metallohydrolase [Anaerolineales bacterium]